MALHKACLALASLLLLPALALCTSSATPSAAPTPNCDVVELELVSCIEFISAKSNAPSQDCCQGVYRMSVASQTQQERQAVCECIKDAVEPIKNIDTLRITSLPQLCGVDLVLPPITRDIDCTKITATPFLSSHFVANEN